LYINVYTRTNTVIDNICELLTENCIWGQIMSKKKSLVKGAVCKIVTKTGTAITFKLGLPTDSRLPDMVR